MRGLSQQCKPNETREEDDPPPREARAEVAGRVYAGRTGIQPVPIRCVKLNNERLAFGAV